MKFTEVISKQIPGFSAKLPTETQWEYACRAGTKSDFNDGSACTEPEGKDPALEMLGWYDANSGGETHRVKKKEANGWGLYDMHGNVWEWCANLWEDESALRSVRGGSWFNQALLCRSAYRNRSHPEDRGEALGLRLAAGQDEPGAAEPPGAERPGEG